jgi:lipopolysaccharide cholinephosphotransferase
MDYVFFREEIKRYIDDTYRQFREYQSIAKQILVEFDRVCEKNQLDYYLAYGSLIGAARDHTLIPWDYDIDTLVRIDDRERLIECLKRDLKNEFDYDYFDRNSTYPTSCLRIYKKGYSMMALHVDVFFLIGTPESENRRSVHMQRLVRIMNLRKSKYIPLYLKKKRGFIGNIKSFVYKIVPGWFITYYENKLMKKYPLADSRLWCSSQSVYKKFYPNDLFKDKTKLFIDDLAFSAPIGYEQFLSIIYGDWKSYLPVKRRFEEFYKMKFLVDERQGV